MQFDASFWVQIIIYALSLGTMYGGLTQRLKNLEEKVNKHNNVVERMTAAEVHIQAEQREIDEIKEELKRKEV